MASRASATVTIYDLVGKIVSSNKFNYEELINYVFGKSLSSGVYQAVITQGDYKETLKIIKN